MHLYEKRNRIANWGLWLGILAFIAAVLLFVLAFSRLTSRNSAREEALVEDAIRRAAVTCYAVEGRYPESLDYLLENYGVVVDRSRYAVRYEAFAVNFMPSILVVRRGGAS